MSLFLANGRVRIVRVFLVFALFDNRHHGIGGEVASSRYKRVVLEIASSLLDNIDVLEVDESLGPLGYVKVALFD